MCCWFSHNISCTQHPWSLWNGWLYHRMSSLYHEYTPNTPLDPPSWMSPDLASSHFQNFSEMTQYIIIYVLLNGSPRLQCNPGFQSLCTYQCKATGVTSMLFSENVSLTSFTARNTSKALYTHKHCILTINDRKSIIGMTHSRQNTCTEND